MSVLENFTTLYNDVRDILHDKTFQPLQTKEIIQVMQIAATLSNAYELHNINEQLEFHFGKSF